jgi:hypothetical protein
MTADGDTNSVTSAEVKVGDGEPARAGDPVPEEEGVTAKKIKNVDSFNEVTAGRHQISGLYFYLQLDCLIDCAHRVALDFFRRPQLYIKVGDARTAGDLARLRARYGSDERIPGQEQRDGIFFPIFSESGSYPVSAQGDFPRLRDELVRAATAFAERVFNTGEEMLRERVRTTHRPFKDYLTGLQGASVGLSRTLLGGVTEELAYKILRDKGVAAVFGISLAPAQEWPYTEDSNADKLVEEISRQLAVTGSSQMAISREIFSNRQRAALRGAEALTTVIDFTEGASDKELDLLITRCYTWGSALRSLVA